MLLIQRQFGVPRPTDSERPLGPLVGVSVWLCLPFSREELLVGSRMQLRSATRALYLSVAIEVSDTLRIHWYAQLVVSISQHRCGSHGGAIVVSKSIHVRLEPQDSALDVKPQELKSFRPPVIQFFPEAEREFADGCSDYLSGAVIYSIYTIRRAEKRVDDDLQTESSQSKLETTILRERIEK